MNNVFCAESHTVEGTDIRLVIDSNSDSDSDSDSETVQVPAGNEIVFINNTVVIKLNNTQVIVVNNNNTEVVIVNNTVVKYVNGNNNGHHGITGTTRNTPKTTKGSGQGPQTTTTHGATATKATTKTNNKATMKTTRTATTQYTQSTGRHGTSTKGYGSEDTGPDGPWNHPFCKRHIYKLRDMFCDDDMNIPECNFDEGDCCSEEKENDFCEECLCKRKGNVKQSITKMKHSKVALIISR